MARGETLGKLSRKSDTAMAVRYALERWAALLRFCDDGRIEIDNNAATSVAGRGSGQKEFSFCGLRWRWRKCRCNLQSAGHRQTERNRSRKLSTGRVVADDPIKRIEELLPWNVAASLSPEIDEAA